MSVLTFDARASIGSHCLHSRASSAQGLDHAGQHFTFCLAHANLTRMEGPLGPSASTALPRAWYGAALAEFLSAEPDGVLGRLAANSGFADVPEQKDA